MKVRYTGETDPLGLINGQIYSVMSVERGWYRISIEILKDDYLFPPELFEIVEGQVYKFEIVHSFMIDDRRCLVLGTGDDITYDIMKIKKIAHNSHVFNVLAVHVTGQMTDSLKAEMIIDNTKPIDLGIYYGAV